MNGARERGMMNNKLKGNSHNNIFRFKARKDIQSSKTFSMILDKKVKPEFLVLLNS